MKTLIFLITFIFLYTFSFGQTDSTKYYVEEIGMNIYVSSEFHLKDSKPKSEYLDYNLKPITDTQKLKALTADEPKTVLEIESIDKKNSMSIILTPITEMFIRTFGDSSQVFEMTKQIESTKVKQDASKIEIPFSAIKVGRFNFYKSFYSYTIRGVTYYEGGYIAKIGNYYLTVKIDYEDKIIGTKLMTIIETSRFD